MKKTIFGIILLALLLVLGCKKTINCDTGLHPLYENTSLFFEQLISETTVVKYQFAVVPFDRSELIRYVCPFDESRNRDYKFKNGYQKYEPSALALTHYKGKYKIGSIDTLMFHDTTLLNRASIWDALIRMDTNNYMILPLSFKSPFIKAAQHYWFIDSILYVQASDHILTADYEAQSFAFSSNWISTNPDPALPGVQICSRFYQAFDGSGVADPKRYEALTLHELADHQHGYAFYTRVMNMKIDGQHYPIVFSSVFPVIRWGYVWLLDTKTFSAQFQIDYAQVGFDQQRTELQVNHVSPSAKSENRHHVFVGDATSINDVELLGARCIISLEDGTNDTIQIQR